MKHIFFTILAVIISTISYGQTKLSAQEQKEIIAKINKTASTMQSMQCDFSQVKNLSMMKSKMQSKGVMYFCKPNKLRWQYTSPYDYTFILNGDKVVMKSSKSTNKIYVNKNKMFRQITDIMMNCMTGESLTSPAYFKVELFKSGDIVYAQLTPIKKEIKQIYTAIFLYFNKELSMVNKVEMREKTGANTTITMTNITKNGKIDDKVFSNN